MMTTQKLDSEKYWNAAVDIELRKIRAAENVNAMKSMFLAVSCCVAFLSVCFAYSNGYFENFDYSASVEGFRNGFNNLVYQANAALHSF